MTTTKTFVKQTDFHKLFGSILSAIVGAICFKYFVFTTNIMPAGFSGLALVFNQVILRLSAMNISIGTLMFLLNVPAFLLAYFGVGKKFSLFSFLNTALCSLLIDILPDFSITTDQFLLVVIGGIIGGISSGIALRVDTSTGGLDFITLYFSVKKNKEVWNYSLAFNVLLLMSAMFLFGFDGVAYSIIYQVIYTAVVKAMHTRYNRKMVFIFTQKGSEVSQLLIENNNRGVTMLDAVGAYSRQENNMLVTVVASAEVERIIRLIRQCDSRAFISITESEQIYGSFYQLPFE